MFLEQLAVVVQEGSDGVLGQDVVANLGLHHAKLLGNMFLWDEDNAPELELQVLIPHCLNALFPTCIVIMPKGLIKTEPPSSISHRLTSSCQ